MTTIPSNEIIRADQRFKTQAGWLDSNPSFNFGQHYDRDNTHHGLLLVNNDDIVLPGTGFQTHPHRDMEIITWVLSGELEHNDTTNHQGIIYPGLAQRMSAGRGIWHSEINPSGDQPVHFVQMWVSPDTESLDPSYEQLDINPQLAQGGLVPVASGRGHDAAIKIGQRDAVLWAGRLTAGESVRLPDSHYLHLYVALGQANLEQAGDLGPGDAVRLTAAGTPQLTAGDEGAEVLIWEME
jgi:redox-sensitive bicupin YhaK (pirin superfamily)